MWDQGRDGDVHKFIRNSRRDAKRSNGGQALLIVVITHFGFELFWGNRLCNHQWEVQRSCWAYRLVRVRLIQLGSKAK